MKHLKSLNVMVISAVLALAGCKALEENQGGARLVVTYAVAKFIEKAGDAPSQVARANRIRMVAEQAISLTDGKDVILSALEATVRVQVAKLSLSPADAVLADGLITLISQELAKKVGEGVLAPEQLVQTKMMLGWIVDATAYAVPAS